MSAHSNNLFFFLIFLYCCFGIKFIIIYHVEFYSLFLHAFILLFLNQRNLLLSIVFRQRIEIPSTLPIELQYMSVEFPKYNKL